MRSRFQRIPELQKLIAVVLVVSLLLGSSIAAVIYTVTANSNAGCYATHAVIRNLDNYFDLQIRRIQAGEIGNHQTPADRAKSIKGYRGVIKALGQVSCS